MFSSTLEPDRRIAGSDRARRRYRRGAMIDARLRDFDDALGRDDDALRERLAHGEALERVWAVWILALRARDGAAVAAQIRGEPNPGVRRALGVVLAGHGHVDLLVALARHDPDAEVRAGAMRLVVRFALAERVPWAVVTEALARDAPPVRVAILGELAARPPAVLRPAIVACLGDDDASVSGEAFELVIRARDRGDDGALHAFLDRRAPDELELAFLTWSHHEAQAAMVAVLAGTSRPVRAAALRWFRDRSWAAIGALVGADPALYEMVRQDHRIDLDVPIELPVMLLLGVDAWDQNSDLIGEVLDRVHRLDTPGAIAAAPRALLARLHDACDPKLVQLAAEAARGRAEGWSTLSWDNGATRDQVAELRDLLRALLDGAPLT
jgi:hypothetical protein